jgi:pyruvate formate lyase activating enzyme
MFKCLYCHNADTIPLTGGTEMTPKEIVQQVIHTKPYFGTSWWFTVSGGEPMLQAKDLIPLFQFLKQEGIHIAVDTNWFPWNDDVKALVELADLFLVDIKHIDDDMHKKLTSQSHQNTFAFIDYLQEKGKHMWIRYVLLSGWTDQAEYIQKIGKKYWSYSMIDRLEILPYHQLWVYKWKELGWEYGLEGVAPTSLDQAAQAKNLFEQWFKKVVIR